MKILSIFLLFTFCMARVYSQSTLPLRADTVVIEKVGGNANFKVKDITRDSTGGVYYNAGGGLLRAKRSRKLNDSTFVVGGDTITLRGGSGVGATTFAGLSDVTITSPKNAQRPVYDSITGKWVNRLPAYFNVRDYGAVGDSVTDDRLAFIKCRDAIYAAGGGVMYIPAGKYRLSDSILFNRPIRIQGVGKSGGLHNNQGDGSLEKDRLGPIETSSEIIVADGKNGFVFERQSNERKATPAVEWVTMSSTVTPGSATGGSFIVIRGMIQGAIIQNSTFYGGYVQIDIQSGYYQKIDGCHFSAAQICNVKSGNNIRTDTGDFTITACTFSSGTFNRTDTTKAIWWHSGGGMRVINCKFDACEFNNSSNYWYDIYVANTIDPTSDIIILGCSFENWYASAIYMRGIVAPYVRNIHIETCQFAPVGSTAPGIDIDNMAVIYLAGFEFRDWGGTVSAPAIKITNCIDVTIGKGEWRDYTSFIDLTGSTNTHVDYMHGGDVAIGSKNTTNIGGLDASLYTTQTTLGRATTGQYGSGVIEVASKLAELPDGTPTDVGYINFAASSNSSGHKRVATIGATLDGPTPGQKGGILHFYTKPDASTALTERLSISSAGEFNFPSYSFTGTVNKLLALTSGGKMIITDPIASQWTTTGNDIYFGTPTLGKAGIGDSSPDVKLDIETSSTGSDGIIVTNTNSGVAARPIVRLLNDANELGQFGMMSSTHATLPNYTLFEATKSLQFGVDQGIASGGTSVINFVTGGYSVAPSFIIKGTGILNASSLAGSGTRMVTASATGDIATTAIPTPTLNDVLSASAAIGGAYNWNAASNPQLFSSTQTVSTAWTFSNNGNGNPVSITANGSGIGLIVSNSSSGQGIFSSSSSGTGGLFSSTTGLALHATTNPSSTNTAVNTFISARSTSGTAAAGLADTWTKQLEQDNGSLVDAATFTAAWTSAANGAASAEYYINTRSSGSMTQKFTIKPTGQIKYDTYGSGTHIVTPATTPVFSSDGSTGERIAPKIYTALLTQSGTSDPTVIVLGTNEIGTIVWTRNSIGNYTGTLTGAFTSDKTWLICQKGDGNGSFINGLLSRASSNALTLDVRDNTAALQDGFTNMSIEIRVYP